MTQLLLCRQGQHVAEGHRAAHWQGALLCNPGTVESSHNYYDLYTVMTAAAVSQKENGGEGMQETKYLCCARC